jgi:hypothetical protein
MAGMNLIFLALGFGLRRFRLKRSAALCFSEYLKLELLAPTPL